MSFRSEDRQDPYSVWKLRDRTGTEIVSGEFSCDSVLRKTEAMSFTADAVLRMTLTQPIELHPSRAGEEIVRVREILESRIVGQRRAIDAVLGSYELALSGLHPSRRPVASFLLLGPTGVGKTLLAESLAEALAESPRPGPLKVHCAEYSHDHEIAKLIGSPPGYIGHRETTPRLSADMLERYRSQASRLTVVLFDEIEKAHSALWDLLLGVLDKGELMTGHNEPVDFTRTILFLTSNLGADRISRLLGDKQIGFGKTAKGGIAAEATASARSCFRPEFFARLDHVIVFEPLTDEQKARIVGMEVARAQERIAGRGVLLEVPADAMDMVFRHGTDKRSGARDVRKTVERELVAPVASLLASGQIRAGDHVLASPFAGELRFRLVAACGR